MLQSAAWRQGCGRPCINKPPGVYDLLLTMLRDRPGSTIDAFVHDVRSLTTYLEELTSGNVQRAVRLTLLRVVGDLDKANVVRFLSDAEDRGMSRVASGKARKTISPSPRPDRITSVPDRGVDAQRSPRRRAASRSRSDILAGWPAGRSLSISRFSSRADMEIGRAHV